MWPSATSYASPAIFLTALSILRCSDSEVLLARHHAHDHVPRLRVLVQQAPRADVREAVVDHHLPRHLRHLRPALPSNKSAKCSKFPGR